MNKALVKKPWATKKSSLVLRLECLLVLLITIFLYQELGGDWTTFTIVLIAIDLSMLGYIVNNHIGGLVYNIGHSYIIPRILLLTALVFNIRPLLLFAIIWNAHISLDRALGYGLKHESFHLTHLGPIGKKAES
jgi:hypothetical protein